MRKIVLLNVRNTVVNVIIVASIFYLYTSLLLGESFNYLLIGLLLLFGFSLIVLIIKWLAFFYFTYLDKHILSYEKSINKNVHFRSRDEIDQKILRIGALYSITLTGANTENGYINSLETNDYSDLKKKEYIRATLKSSWDISSKNDLFYILDDLMDCSYMIQVNPADLMRFKKLLLKNDLNFEFSTVSFDLDPRPFNIQRAVILLRDALTCDMITFEEFDQHKYIIDTFINDYFQDSSWDDFIVSYLLGVYDFYAGQKSQFFVFGINRINERMAGVKVLYDNHFYRNQIK